MDDEYKESSGHLSNPHSAPGQHPPAVADPYYQHQYHHQYHHHHQYHYPPGGSAPPDVGQYGPVNDANEIIQGDETEPKPPPKKLPKPPKSAFVLFSEFKHEERKKSGEAICKKDAIAFVADAWRSLSESERHYWTEQERNDKLRYVQEKEQHQGPWEQPKRRAKKNPLAPKRPMSAFLKYSKTRRREVKEDNPDMSNTDISRLLGEMWRNASPEERRPYREQEEKERAVYKAEIAKWRADQARIEQERALAMPATSSASSVADEPRLGAHTDDIAHQHYHHHHHHHQQRNPPAYDGKVPTVPYEYAKLTNPLNHHDPNGSHYNEPYASYTDSQYSESTGRGDRYDYSYAYNRPDYRQEHFHHHDQYRHQHSHHSGNDGDARNYSHLHSESNDRHQHSHHSSNGGDASTHSHGHLESNGGGGGYSDYRHQYHAPPSSHHQYSRSSQEGGGHCSYTYDSGTSALLAAAASDSIDQQEDHSEKDRAKDPYHYSFSTATDNVGGTSHRVDNQQNTEDYEGGNDANDGNDDRRGDDDEATVQYSYSDNEQQESSSPPTDPNDDPDMPPPLPPPQVELPSSSPSRGFIVSL